MPHSLLAPTVCLSRWLGAVVLSALLGSACSGSSENPTVPAGSGGAVAGSGGSSSQPGVGGGAQTGGAGPTGGASTGLGQGGASNNGGGVGVGGNAAGVGGNAAGGATSATGTGGASTGSTSAGGSSTGGSARGGTSAGGSSNGGTSKGGQSAGGTNNGGNATGGANRGGANTGGQSAGGTATGGSIGVGGTTTGGAATGGAATGGAATGGTATGGTATGGVVATGGKATGGASTGGVSTGGSGTGTCTTSSTVYSGHVTSYTLGSGPSCHTGTSGNPTYTAAMNEQDYNAAAVCGACVEVTNTVNNQKLVVTIIDLCPVAGNEQWCYNGSHHIDLTTTSYAAIGATNNPAVTWRYVSCSYSTNIQYVWEGSATQYWLALTIKNHTNPIKTVELKGTGSYVTLARADYNVFSTSSSLGAGPFTIRVTDIYGNVIEESLTLSPGSTITGTKQFPKCN